jgi:hypothetical protein
VYVTVDGEWGIEVKARLQGVRDLSEEAIILARWVSENPKRRGLLVSTAPVTSENLRKEWGRIKLLLSEEIRRRIAFAEFTRDLVEIRCPDWLKDIIRDLRNSAKAAPRRIEAHGAPGLKFFEVTKLLLNRWIRLEEPWPVLELARQADCSYPTVRRALNRLGAYGELSRTSRRSVSLADFPRRTWSEFLALLPQLRKTVTYEDASGRPFDPDVLLARLRRTLPSNIGIGGVCAARRLDPAFDLHGTPRVDLVVHTPSDRDIDLSFLARLDPALRQTPTVDVGHLHRVVLAVHQLSRRTPLFERDSKESSLVLADPVEVLLDLHELRLDRQAEELIEKLRGRA